MSIFVLIIQWQPCNELTNRELSEGGGSKKIEKGSITQNPLPPLSLNLLLRSKPIQ